MAEKCIPVHHHTGHLFKFILPALTCMALIFPRLSIADDMLKLVSALDVKGTTGTAYWSTPSRPYSREVLTNLIIVSHSQDLFGIPGLGITTNCNIDYTTKDGKKDTIVSSVRYVNTSSWYYLPEPANIASYASSCRTTLTNGSPSNIDLAGKDVVDISFHWKADDGMNGGETVVMGSISTGTLYTTPSCTLSVPDPAINFSGDATRFINGIRRSASFSATCEGTSSAALLLRGTGALDTEGCLSAQKPEDPGQALRLCADGFRLDASNSKALTMDGSGNSTGSIDFTLSSYNNETPQPGEYKTTVYATIAPN